RALEGAARDAGWDARFVDKLGDGRVPPAVETAAFRILQESLVNASRHAMSATVEVELARQPGWLCLDVRDDGIGLARAAASGAGGGPRLPGMPGGAR